MKRMQWGRVIPVGLLLVLAGVAAAADAPMAPFAEMGPDFRTVCWAGDLDRVTDLLQRGAPLEETDRLGRTPLILAAHGNPGIVKLLLEHGAKVDAVENDGDTPLCIAVEHGQLANVQALLAKGADINHVNKYGRTPVILAAREGYDEILSYLLAQHANLDCGEPQSPALWYAVWRDHRSTAEILLAAGEPVSMPESVRKSAKDWGTIMGTAANTGDRALIDLLLDHGGDINETDADGRSAFFSLLQRSNDADLIAHLLQRGANPNLPAADGTTPFMTAVDYADPPIVKLLAQNGANVNAQDANGQTELMIMCAFKNLKKVQELMALHPDVNLQDKAGETALTYAADRGSVEIVRILESAGAEHRAFHVIPKPLREELTRPQLWALAVGALYAQSDGLSHDSLPQDNEKKGAMSIGLKRDWDITDRDQFLECLHGLEGNPSWSETALRQIKDVATEPGAWWDRLWELIQLLYLDLKWRGRLHVAWNACREANLIRIGVTIGYISESDAWPILFRNARRVQATYGSWKEMNDSFLDIREIWAGERDPEFRVCAEILLNPKDANSPWNRLAWTTDLGK